MRAAYTSDMTQQSVTAARREAARQRTGQFGEQQHSAPEVALALDSFTFDDLDAAEERRAEAARERAATKAWLDTVKKSASFHAYHRGLGGDRKDIEGDTIVDILEQRSPMNSAYVSKVVKNKTAQYVNPGEHHTSITARRSLHVWTEAFLQENGRWPSPAERAAKAREIRFAMPAGNRASEGFEDRRVVLSLEGLTEGFAGEEESIETLISVVEQSDYAIDTSSAARANDALEDDGSSFRAADARKNIWNLLAGDAAPRIAVKTIGDDRAHRAAIDSIGGPTAAARAWAAGDTSEDDPATSALFAPFGSHLTEKDRESVVNVLTRNAEYADKIWDSAMTAALDVQRLRSIKRRESRNAATQAERELLAA